MLSRSCRKIKTIYNNLNVLLSDRIFWMIVFVFNLKMLHYLKMKKRPGIIA